MKNKSKIKSIFNRCHYNIGIYRHSADENLTPARNKFKSWSTGRI